MSWGFTLDPYDTVAEIIKSWEPSECKNEKDYEESLYKELSSRLKKQKIQRQYGSSPKSSVISS